ncbi:type II toxin-antitoxin system RelE/ParE family toxin [Pararhizobium gei]|uniref:type II toxin-antitoxin system RelE/ParE family toxin n=1 Tax=Pararhizobium gei TaxID=1395951 RepID=UPI0023D9863D|nr:type II toxin-antitoxin system RelE/ParE family toxin [Rhizobium gei]
MKLRIYDEAAAYLRAERAYLSRFDKRAASAMVQQLRQAMEMLRRFPQAGQALESVPGVRRFTVPPYIIDYEVMDGTLGVLVIRHGRQHDPDIISDAHGDFEDI